LETEQQLNEEKAKQDAIKAEEQKKIAYSANTTAFAKTEPKNATKAEVKVSFEQ
jgi:hypothetical protein